MSSNDPVLDALIDAVTRDDTEALARLCAQLDCSADRVALSVLAPEIVDWLLLLAAQELALRAAEHLVACGATTLQGALLVACGQLHYARIGALGLYGPSGEFTPYDLPVERRLVMIDWLLGRGADPKGEDPSGKTPLHYAASLRHGEAVIERLVAVGAPLEAIDRMGRTPLHYAALANRVGGVRALLLAGAAPRPCDHGKQAPYQLTESRTIKEYLAGIGLRPQPPSAPPPPKPQVVAGRIAGALVLGARVQHRTFGAGTITAIVGEGDDARVTVAFTAGEKRLAARFLTS